MKEFWDLEESKGFNDIIADDGLTYKVWNSGDSKLQQEVADTLARVRKDLNTLLIYIYDNPQLWNNKPIAFGVFHTFDIHIPCWTTKMQKSSDQLNKECIKIGKLFNYQEMTPNDYGIIGLNKPKKIITIPIERNGKIIDYEIAEKRSIFLTIRGGNGKINKYSGIIDLAIHEITHTVCNDVRWKKDNHLPPYQSYHNLMRKWARECGVLN